MTLKEFISLNKESLNNPKFNIEQVISENGLGLKGWNKLSNPQRVSFIILYCVNSGHKIYYLFRRSYIYLYIYKKAYTNSFFLGFDLLNERYENLEDLKDEISTRLMADHTEELTSVNWIDRVRKLLEPVEE